MSEVKLIRLPYESSLARLYPAVQDLDYPILLDSNHDSFSDTRWDILSAAPIATLTAQGTSSDLMWHTPAPFELSNQENPMDTLRLMVEEITNQPWSDDVTLPFNGGLLGYYGYEAGRYVEQLPESVIEDVHLPTLLVGLYGWALISDHQTKTTSLVMTPWCQFDEQTLLDRLTKLTPDKTVPFSLHSAFEANMSAQGYAERFEKVKNYIKAGDCYQVNLTQRFSASYEGDTWSAYLALKAVCPTPFSAYFKLPDGRAVLSHSPERFILCDQGRVESKPIKGTRARGENAKQDAALAEELLASEKDRAENLMIVDLLRNDLGKNCVTGSVKVPILFGLESYANVHHMVSTVEGRVAKKADALTVFQEGFPGGSITGAPKVRAMEIIDELEPHERSVYCGSMIYFGCNGQMDSSITIRTLVADGQKIHCWAGGGLVADSICEEEYQETFTKIGRLTHTLEKEFLR